MTEMAAATELGITMQCLVMSAWQDKAPLPALLQCGGRYQQSKAGNTGLDRTVRLPQAGTAVGAVCAQLTPHNNITGRRCGMQCYARVQQPGPGESPV